MARTPKKQTIESKLHIVKADTSEELPAGSETPAPNTPPPLTEAFKAKATKHDAQIVKTISLIGVSFTKLGQLFSEAKAKGYHVALGYNSFTDYLEARYPEKSKTQVYMAMATVKELTAGDKPAITPEDLEAMPQQNAQALAKLHKQGVKVTSKVKVNGESVTLLEAAKSMPIRTFQEKVVHPRDPKAAQKAAVAKGTTIAGGAQVSVGLKYDVTPDTAAMVNRCSEVFKYVGRDGDQSISFQDRFLQALAAEFLAGHEAEYEQAKQEEEAQGVHAALNADSGLVDAVIVEEDGDFDMDMVDGEDVDFDEDPPAPDEE